MFDRFGNLSDTGPLAHNLQVGLHVSALDDTVPESQLPGFEPLTPDTFTAGHLHAAPLRLHQNAKGSRGYYTTQLISIGDLRPANLDLPSFRFHFTNSIANKLEVQHLEKQKSEHLTQRDNKQERRAAIDSLINGHRANEQQIHRDLTELTREVLQLSVGILPSPLKAQQLEPDSIQRVIEFAQKHEPNNNRPNNNNNNFRKIIPPHRSTGLQNVFGYFGNLICFERDDVCLQLCARLLNQGMGLKVLVCATLQAATNHQADERVLALETASGGAQDWPRTVPHQITKFGGDYFGNHVTFPSDPDLRFAALRAFNALVGERMFFPTLAAGNLYRTQMRGKVGLLINLDGTVIQSSGVFGGANSENNRPALHNLKYAFGKEFHNLRQEDHKKLIQKLLSLAKMQKRDIHAAETSDVREKQRQSAELQAQIHEHTEALKSIEQKLRMVHKPTAESRSYRESKRARTT
eukprot:m.61970 g.61970  ORF g.61970 m.61970 type:complete len:465 (-) comp23065_c1_seq1:116-1510(-)